MNEALSDTTQALIASGLAEQRGDGSIELTDKAIAGCEKTCPFIAHQETEIAAYRRALSRMVCEVCIPLRTSPCMDNMDCEVVQDEIATRFEQAWKHEEARAK